MNDHAKGTPTHRGLSFPHNNWPIKVEHHTVVHEVGHLVVGFYLNLDEQGIIFRSYNPDEAAQAVARNVPDRPLIIRSFGGIIAHLMLAPNSLERHLLNAYEHSVIFTPDHPHSALLTEDEKTFLSGAMGDMQIANAAVCRIISKSQRQIQYLKKAEALSRRIVDQNRERSERVINDVYLWSDEQDRTFDQMLFYPVHRARRAFDLIQ